MYTCDWYYNMTFDVEKTGTCANTIQDLIHAMLAYTRFYQ